MSRSEYEPLSTFSGSLAQALQVSPLQLRCGECHSAGHAGMPQEQVRTCGASQRPRRIAWIAAPTMSARAGNHAPDTEPWVPDGSS